MSSEFTSLCNHQQPLGLISLVMLGHSSLFWEGAWNFRPWEEVQTYGSSKCPYFYQYMCSPESGFPVKTPTLKDKLNQQCKKSVECP